MKIDYWEKFEENTFYHIYNRGINRENLFREKENYVFLLDRWKKLITPWVETVAYCLMPNHFHFLVRIKPITVSISSNAVKEGTVRAMQFAKGEVSFNDFLEDQFKRTFSSYSLAFNHKYGRTGSLMQKRFKRIAVKTDNKLFHLLTYIHHNPIHHKFCTAYGEWPYCSYQSYQQLDKPSMLIREEVLSWFTDPDVDLVDDFDKLHQDFQLGKQYEDYYLE
jgi:REP element-mobilizing transposase RayT